MIRTFAILATALWGMAACAPSTEAPLWDSAADEAAVLTTFAALDDRSLSVEEQLTHYTDNAVILVPNETEIRGEAALRDHLSAFGQGVAITTQHEIVELTSFVEVVAVQGRVVGTAQPDGDPNIYNFETKNLILFERQEDGTLKIWKVIYNAAPVSQTQ